MLILAGPPGAGKTTVAKLVADRSDRSVCLEADWFWTTVVGGFVPPWQSEAADQNRALIRAVAAAGTSLAADGYHVVIDGVIGPWYLPVAVEEARRNAVAVDYVVLRPSLATSLERAMARAGDERVPGHPALTDEEPIRHMWAQFADLGPYERHVVDTSELTVEQTADMVCGRVDDGSARISPS